MAKVKPDLSFEREGRGLGAWLLDVMSPEETVRNKAGEVLQAMAFGLPSAHTDFADIEGDLPEGDGRMAEWRTMVRAAVPAEEFPRRAFFAAVAAGLTGAEAVWMRNAWSPGRAGEQFRRFVEELGEARGRDRARRLGRAMSARLPRAAVASPDRSPAFSMADVASMWVFEAIGPLAAVEAPEAVWMLLEGDESGGTRHMALKALEEAGPAVAGEFYGWLVERSGDAKGLGTDVTAALASVGRKEPGLVQRALDEISQATARAERKGWNDVRDGTSGGPKFYKAFYHADRTWTVAGELARLGAGVGRREEVLAALMGLSRSPWPGHRGAAAMAMGPVGRGIGGTWEGRVVDRLLEMTRDHDWVVGRAIDALGTMGADAARVVPRLVELFDEFEEFDPDEAYGGWHARVCRAIAAFGERGALAVPRLVAALREEAKSPDVGGDEFPADLVSALGAIGPAAAEALPLLEAIREKRNGPDAVEEGGPPDNRRDPAGWAVWRVRGS